MIYLVCGNDTEKINNYLKKLGINDASVFLSPRNINREMLFSYASQVSLFGKMTDVVLSNSLLESEVVFDIELLSLLQKSKSIFVFVEDSMTASEIKKYKKYLEEDVSFKKQEVKEKGNPFLLANSFGMKKKMDTWVLYLNAIEKGEAPEAISGMLFWKIKTMYTEGTTVFKKDELKRMSSELVDIYHMSHSGGMDFTIGLEHFILRSLS